jgi:hypothetical protein
MVATGLGVRRETGWKMLCLGGSEVVEVVMLWSFWNWNGEGGKMDAAFGSRVERGEGVGGANLLVWFWRREYEGGAGRKESIV